MKTPHPFRKQLLILAALVLNAAAVTACGGSDGGGPMNPPPPPSSPLGSFPAGSYMLDAQPGEVTAGNVGVWILTFEADADFRATKDGAVVVQGNVLVSNNQIILRDLAGSFSCAPPTDKGTYGWVVSANLLTLTLVSDGCSGRRDVLTVEREWEKQ